MQSALDRRRGILESLLQRRHDTVPNLAREYSVSEKTIRRDLCILSHDYPVETIPGNGGGVFVSGNYFKRTGILTSEQFHFLNRIAKALSAADQVEMRNIILTLKNYPVA